MTDSDTNITRAERERLIDLMARQADMIEREGYSTAARCMRYAIDDLRHIQRVENA